MCTRSCPPCWPRWVTATTEPVDGAVRVRRAELADLDDVAALEAHFPSDRLSRRQLRHLLTRAHAEAWVAEVGGRIVGDAVVLFRRGFDAARLYSLVVAPDSRGHGVGSALLRAAERGAAERGCVSVRLEVREDNDAARRLYLRHGYEVVGHADVYYHDGADALRMRKRLRGDAPELAGVPFVPQSLPFTCGPACLMMAMRAFGDASPPDRAEELALWREATTVFLAAGHGGCSPHGLAVAALRRGHRVEVLARDAAVPFLDSVRDPDKKAVIELAHGQFTAELRRAGVPVRVGPFGLPAIDAALAADGIPILLVSGYRLYQEKAPHWVVITGTDDEHVYLHDPFVPEGAQRADGVHLPLARSAFERVATFGKARHRYLVVIGPRRRRRRGVGQVPAR